MTDREYTGDPAAPSTYYGGTATPGEATDTGSLAGRGGAAKDQAKETAGKAQERAGEAMDTAKQKADQVTHQATERTDAGMDKAAEGFDKAAGMLRDRSQDMGGDGAAGTAHSAATMAADQLEMVGQYMRDKDTDQIVADLEALVRRRPVESVLVAAGVGFLLSKALR